MSLSTTDETDKKDSLDIPEILANFFLKKIGMPSYSDDSDHKHKSKRKKSKHKKRKHKKSKHRRSYDSSDSLPDSPNLKSKVLVDDISSSEEMGIKRLKKIKTMKLQCVNNTVLQTVNQNNDKEMKDKSDIPNSSSKTLEFYGPSIDFMLLGTEPSCSSKNDTVRNVSTENSKDTDKNDSLNEKENASKNSHELNSNKQNDIVLSSDLSVPLPTKSNEIVQEGIHNPSVSNQNSEFQVDKSVDNETDFLEITCRIQKESVSKKIDLKQNYAGNKKLESSSKQNDSHPVVKQKSSGREKKHSRSHSRSKSRSRHKSPKSKCRRKSRSSSRDSLHSHRKRRKHSHSHSRERSSDYKRRSHSRSRYEKHKKYSKSWSLSPRERRDHRRSISKSRGDKRSLSKSRGGRKSRSKSRGDRRSRSKSRRDRRSRSKSREVRRSRSKSREDRRSRSKSRGDRRSRSKSRRDRRSRSKSQEDRRSRSKSRGDRRSRSKTRGDKRSPKHSDSRRRQKSYSRDRECSLSKSRHKSRSRRRPSHTRSRSKSRHRKSSHSEEKSRSRSSSKEKKSSSTKIDQAKILETARKNVLKMMKSGTLPEGLPVENIKKEQLISIQAGGKSVQELTDFCQRLSQKENEPEDNEDKEEKPDDETGFIHHPFKVKEPGMIKLNIKNAVQLPIKTHAQKVAETARLSSQFPVSSGNQHKQKELEWIPVVPDSSKTDTKPVKTAAVVCSVAVTTAASNPTVQVVCESPVLSVSTPPVSSIPMPISYPSSSAVAPVVQVPLPPPPLPPILEPPLQPAFYPMPSQPVMPTYMMFNQNTPAPPLEMPTASVFKPPKKLDIPSIVAKRFQALTKLQQDPNDPDALKTIQEAQRSIQEWVESQQVPGLFTGSTDAKMLTAAELCGPKYHKIRKDIFSHAPPVTEGKGMSLLKKMGWNPGEGLGKNNEGSLEPLMLDIKLDKKGLVSEGENSKKGTNSFIKELQGKHPVSALMELCSKRRWKPPMYTCVMDNGPPHKKLFCFKVEVNGVEYQPVNPCSNKKVAKADAAVLCLQSLNILSKAV